jgi:replicative DNA helicase
MPKPSDLIQQSIIGCLLLYPEEIDLVTSIIAPADFVSELHRTVYLTILENPKCDFVSLSPKMKPIVESATLSDWMNAEFTSSYLPQYCRELKEIAIKEKLWTIACEVRNGCESMSSAALLELIEKGLAGLSLQSKVEPKTMRELCLSASAELERRYHGKELSGIPYGLTGLDAVTGGLHRGDMVVVAGRPSMGKTAFVGNILENAAKKGHRGLSFSIEMPAMQCMDRLLASQSEVSLTRIRKGAIEDRHWLKIMKGFESMHTLPLLIDDSPSISLAEIKSKARNVKRNGGLDLIAVDYLTLVKVEERKGESRTRAIGDISRGLKALARELDVTMLAIAQLNRGVDSRQDKRPAMSDLRDSGEIEQDADVILFPFRPAAYCEKCRDKIVDAGHNWQTHAAEAEIIVEKQRNGERNVSIQCAWNGGWQRFSDKEVVYGPGN